MTMKNERGILERRRTFEPTNKRSKTMDGLKFLNKIGILAISVFLFIVCSQSISI